LQLFHKVLTLKLASKITPESLEKLKLPSNLLPFVLKFNVFPSSSVIAFSVSSSTDYLNSLFIAPPEINGINAPTPG